MAYIPLENVVDNKWSALGGTTFEDNVDDLELAWLHSKGATADHVNQAWRQVFFIFGPTTALTGTVTVGVGLKAVVGVGTLFTTELEIGDVVIIAGEAHFVADITDDLNMTLAKPHITGAAGVGYKLAEVKNWNDSAYAYLGGLGHTSESLDNRWATFWAGVLP